MWKPARWFAVVIYSILFAELFLREFSPEPLIPRFVTDAPDGIRTNQANITFRQSTSDVSVLIHYNDQGMRDDRPAPSLTRTRYECRIALLGDSYFTGFESDYGHSFAKLLEENLTTKYGPTRVLNFAVSGFGTAEMYKAMQTRAIKWAPDVIIMSWHSSDPGDNIRSNLYGIKNGVLFDSSQSYLPGVKISNILMRIPGYPWVIENSQLYSAVREKLSIAIKALVVRYRLMGASSNISKADEEAPTYSAAADKTVYVGVNYQSRDRDLNVALVETASQYSIGHGSHFLLFDIPFPFTRTTFYSPANRWLRGLVGVDVVSPLSVFAQSASVDRPLYWEHGNWHWTPLGNKLAAEVAGDEIDRKGWLRHCRGVGG